MLIGFIGPKGSGKDTCADYVCNRYMFKKVSYADCLKRACKELFIMSDEQLYGTQEQKETPDLRWFGATPRTILQYVGTDLLRNQLEKIMPGLGKDIFINNFRLWYKNQDEKMKVVIADVRFQNEADTIKELGGILMKIERPNLGKSSDTHESEVELHNIKNYDYTIKNDKEGDIQHVYDQVSKAIADYVDTFVVQFQSQ